MPTNPDHSQPLESSKASGSDAQNFIQGCSSSHNEDSHQEQSKRKVKGSNPGSSTVRAKLQKNRSLISSNIARELRLRDGAENLLRATENEVVRDKVNQVLDKLNEELEEYRKCLCDVNSALTEYQPDGNLVQCPLIPFPMKEMKNVDLTKPLERYLCDHYYEEPGSFKEELAQLKELRKAIRTPSRSEDGATLLIEYFNQLYYIDQRFCPPRQSIGLCFTWYDTLLGCSATQRSISFEKASVLFNIAALYTQIACKQTRNSDESITMTQQFLSRARAALLQLQTNFTQAPTLDMQSTALKLFINLISTQLEELKLSRLWYNPANEQQPYTNQFTNQQLELICKSACHLYNSYCSLMELMRSAELCNYTAPSWVELCSIKSQHYKALSFYSAARIILDSHDHEYRSSWCGSLLETQSADLHDDFNLAARSVLHAAVFAQESALLQLHRATTLRSSRGFIQFLLTLHDAALDLYISLEVEDDFSELLPVRQSLMFSEPLLKTVNTRVDFKVPVDDIFHRLGNVAIFSSREKWSAPRRISLPISEPQLGFSVRGERPCIVSQIEPASPAQIAGMKSGDFIFSVRDFDTRTCTQPEVVRLVRESAEDLWLTVVTPEKDYLTPRSNPSTPSASRSSSFRRVPPSQ